MCVKSIGYKQPPAWQIPANIYMDSLNAALLMCALLSYSLLINPPDMGNYIMFFSMLGLLKKN